MAGLTDHRSAPVIAPANHEQFAAWNGVEGELWTEHADRYDRTGRRQWQRLVDAGLIGPTDAVLDVGCGTGQSSRDAARIAVAGHVLGVDLSVPMLDLARQRAEADGLTNVAFVQADAQLHPFDPGHYDVAISCFGAMFFGDPIGAFRNIALALRADARLALLAWQGLDRNEWLTELRAALAVGRALPTPPPDAPTPFALADPSRVTSLLTEAGYRDITFTSVDEPMDFGADADEALAFMQTLGIVRGLTEHLDPDDNAKAFDGLRATIAAHAGSDGVLFGSAAWLITAARSGLDG